MRIGEAAGASGLTAKTLRFYEDRGLLPEPNRSANGYRDYGSETVARLEFILRSRAAGLTLNQIREVLRIRDSGHAPCTHVQQLLAAQLSDLDQRITELVTLRAAVSELHDAAANADPAACDPAQICSYL